MDTPFPDEPAAAHEMMERLGMRLAARDFAAYAYWHGKEQRYVLVVQKDAWEQRMDIQAGPISRLLDPETFLDAWVFRIERSFSQETGAPESGPW